MKAWLWASSIASAIRRGREACLVGKAPQSETTALLPAKVTLNADFNNLRDTVGVFFIGIYW
jgi:hypothetical protein